MRFASLGSGSRGNGTLIEMGGERILVDCGFTLKQAEARLARLDLKGADISAVLVTHEHSDHAGGVAALAYKYALPVFASFGTLKASSGGGTPLLGKPINSHSPFEIGAVTVHPVVVPHDAREPTQFVFENAGCRFGVVSDLGHVTSFVTAAYQRLDGLLMEANYDEQMLMRGRYPASVKRRIASELGHLSNPQSVAFLEAVAHDQLEVLVGHISQENNHLDLLEAAFAPLRSRVRQLRFASQDQGADWITVTAIDEPAPERPEPILELN
ncbi:MAG: MBL fold metallo-hydrolase [Pseudomonadales bacterium]|nr:MBL fold metallo-hydrolase [Pseudomonadales bacterium]